MNFSGLSEIQLEWGAEDLFDLVNVLSTCLHTHSLDGRYL
jgi:hypothetical protein